MCVYFLFVGAYSYTWPDYFNSDLLRSFPQIEFYGTMSFFDALVYDVRLPAKNFLFWLFGSLHLVRMVPAISTATVYAVAGYITCDTAVRYNGEKYIGTVFLIQLFLLPYVSLINNIRNVFGLVLVILAAYLDIVKGKRNIFVCFCYLFGTLMHVSVYPLILFRMFSWLGKKYFELFLFGQLFFAAIVFKIYELRSVFAVGGSFGIIIQSFLRKLNGYLLNTTGVGAVKYLNEGIFSARTFIVAGLVFALAMIWYAVRSKDYCFRDDKRFYSFIGMIATMAITFHFFMLVPNYWRFAAAFNAAIGMLYIPLLCSYNSLSFILKLLFRIHLLLVPLVLLFYVTAYFRAFYYSDWILDLLTTNYITIICDLVQSLLNL